MPYVASSPSADWEKPTSDSEFPIVSEFLEFPKFIEFLDAEEMEV
jgi:hypothetical protein